MKKKIYNKSEEMKKRLKEVKSLDSAPSCVGKPKKKVFGVLAESAYRQGGKSGKCKRGIFHFS